MKQDTKLLIEGYDNRIRRHSGLGYLSPLEFEKELAAKEKSQAEKVTKKEERSESFVSCGT